MHEPRGKDTPLRLEWAQQPRDDLCHEALSETPHFLIRSLRLLLHVKNGREAVGETLLPALTRRKVLRVATAKAYVQRAELAFRRDGTLVQLSHECGEGTCVRQIICKRYVAAQDEVSVWFFPVGTPGNGLSDNIGHDAIE